ncbi:MAG: type I polyketide synthase, partial [Desulfobacterales bacterium]|nr:type I polyketide synthase [Desulfobacterales bacterium]
MEDVHDYSDRVAVIGMSCRFPGAPNVDRFWRNLRDGVESVTFFTREELKARGVDETMLNHPDYVRANAVLEDVEMFDADFFDFTPREAEITDPQHRVLLECAWESLENGGCDQNRFDGLIGVYAGAGMSTYLLHNLLSNPDVVESVSDFQLYMAANKDFAPTRVSYKLNLKGPSISIGTACSTSLVAVHMACQGLLDYHCDMALAGGVGIQTPQRRGYLRHEGDILSPDGHCRAFDARASGTVNGSGAGVVLLKRLEDALADGDAVRAVIRGSAVNNDGAAKVGYTAPGVEGQAGVIAAAHAAARVNPETITMIEAHGTGTPLGDPVEMEALAMAFGARTQKKGFCAIGSVKTNFGHLDEAAGAAGLIKAILSLERGMIPPSLHFRRPNPEIDFENSPFYVNTALTPWKRNGAPRRAGVSSFGIGGSNAHVVLEEAPPRPPGARGRDLHLLTLSAETGPALAEIAANLAAHLEKNPRVDLADAAYTLHVGRKRRPHGRILVCRGRAEAVSTLAAPGAEPVFAHHRESEARPSLAFIFPGECADPVRPPRELYATEPLFRDGVDRCAEILAPRLGLDLRTLLAPGEEERRAAARELNRAEITLPFLFVVEAALARLWKKWIGPPGAVLGRGLGEYAAAH